MVRRQIFKLVRNDSWFISIANLFVAPLGHLIERCFCIRTFASTLLLSRDKDFYRSLYPSGRGFTNSTTLIHLFRDFS